MLRILSGERLWKLYLLRPTISGAEQTEHRIYTKEQLDGRIGLVSYSLRITQSQVVRSDLAYAKDIPKDILNSLIWNVVRQTRLRPEELEVIDLTHLPGLTEQIDYLTELTLEQSDE